MRLRLDEIKLIHECLYTPDVLERVLCRWLVVQCLRGHQPEREVRVAKGQGSPIETQGDPVED